YISINSLPLSESQEAFCVVVTDLTEQKHKEEIVAAEKLARSIIEQATEAVVVCDEEGKIIRFSHAVSRILGYDPSFQSFEDLFDLQLPIGRKLFPVSMALRGEVILGIEAGFERSDGRMFHMLLNAGPLKSSGDRIIGCVVTLSDITERKRIEETLRENEALLRSFFDSPGIMRGIVDVVDGDILYISYNSAVAAFYSLPPEAICGKLASQLNVPQKVLQVWLDRFEESRHTSQAVTFEMLYPRPDCIMWLLATFSYLGIGPTGHPRFAFALLDITERKQTERALQEKKEEIEVQAEELESMNEELLVNNESLQAATKSLQESQTLLRAVTDGIPDPIFIKDRESRLILANPAMLRVIGKPLEEVISKDDREHYDDPAVWGAIMANDRRIMKSGQTEVIEEVAQTPKGYRTFLSTKTPYRNGNGEIIGILGVSQDITELKRTEEALRETKDYLENLIEYANAPIIVWDTSFRITRFNHAFERLTGLRAAEALGEPLEILFPEESKEQSLEHIGRTLSGERWEAMEIPILRVDGSIRTVLWNSASIYDKDGKMVIATIAQGQDITERKQAEEALRQARDELELRVHERTAELQYAKEDLEVVNEELRIEIDEHEKTEKELLRSKEEAEAAVKAKSLFLANMSHELRTPMNAVIGFTGLLLDEPLTPEQKDYLVSIRNSGNALLALISDLLDFSRIERENVEMEDQPFDLRRCAEEALDLVAGEASKKNLDLVYSIDRDMPEAITGDPARLRQVLVNLLGNAVKYTDEGEAVLSVSSKEQDEILFEIRDTGIGIPEDKVNILFQPFSRVDESFSSGYEGAGLGLAISKKLVEMMGGKIWVESEAGKGSTFFFTIKTKAVPGKPKAIPTSIQPKLEGKHVLIVDDNKTNRLILGKQLHSWGILPVVEPSSQDALALIKGGAPFDVAILDMMMPEMDGVALAKEIRKYKKDMPLILLSSASQRGKLELFEAVLNKPIKPAQLYKVLSDTLAVQQSREEAEIPVVEADHSPLRILLAEDNVSNQKVTLQMLKKLGYRADAVANGAEAIQALERQHYDLILMDIKMPGLGGIEATRMIRERWPDNGLKIVAITAYALYGDKEKCLAAGMDDYIGKPVQKEDLAKMLEKYQSL
ncbi:MAG TPA: PAS domain S-box protein, partial [Methanotrichaceae archaeon]|nr:PAS domain S-box protein [Methanotrichaceae archaeon]